MYASKASKKALEYKFPFKNEFINFIILASVFTHMILEDVENYVSEIARVLKIGQGCFCTFFLINTRNSSSNVSDFHWNDFAHKFEGFQSRDPNIPEKAIAFDEGNIRELFEKNGLRIIEPIHYRLGVKKPLSKQDIIIATKM